MLVIGAHVGRRKFPPALFRHCFALGTQIAITEPRDTAVVFGEPANQAEVALALKAESFGIGNQLADDDVLTR